MAPTNTVGGERSPSAAAVTGDVLEELSSDKCAALVTDVVGDGALQVAILLKACIVHQLRFNASFWFITGFYNMYI